MRIISTYRKGMVLVFSFSLFLSWTPAQSEESLAKSPIRLVVRGDDIGSSHTANVACIQTYREGIVRSVEVMVPAPWFNEAVVMLNDNPGLDVGVHLTVTSEWELCKWGPMTHAPSLMDAEGHFHPFLWPNPNFPTSLLDAKPDRKELETELRAQIELAMKKIPAVSHLSGHMGSDRATPEIESIVTRLSQEYRLPLELPEAKSVGFKGGGQMTPEAKENDLVQTLQNLEPGLWIFVDHPGLDTPEMRSLGHKGYENVAADRQGVTHAFTSERVKQVVRDRGIELLSYKDAFKR